MNIRGTDVALPPMTSASHARVAWSACSRHKQSTVTVVSQPTRLDGCPSVRPEGAGVLRGWRRCAEIPSVIEFVRKPASPIRTTLFVLLLLAIGYPLSLGPAAWF